MAAQNEELISNYIDRTGIEADTVFMLKHLNDVYDAYKKIAATKITLDGVSSLKAAEAAAKSLAAAEERLVKIQKDAAAIRLTEAKAAKESAGAKLNEAKASTEAAKAKSLEEKASLDATKTKALENKESENSIKTKKAEQKAIDDISNEYKQLVKAYDDAALKAKNLALVAGKDNPIALQAAKEAKALKDFINSINENVGNFTGSVGNYKKGFSELNFSMQQLLRETPALAINLNTFFLAISNNLPMFMDAVKNAKAANVELAATGQKPVSVLSQIGKGLFSVQSLLTIGITLLTLYGAKLIDWAGSIFKGDDATKRMIESQKQLGEQYKATTEIIKKQTEALSDARKEQLLKAAKDLELAEKSGLKNDYQLFAQKKDLANQEKKLSGEQRELFIKDANARDENVLNGITGIKALQNTQDTYFTHYRSNLNQLQDKEAQLEAARTKGKKTGKLEDEVKDLQAAVTTFKAAYDDITSVITDANEKQKKVEELAVEEQKFTADQRREIAHETAIIEANSVIDKNQKILNSEKSTLEERLAATKNVAAQQRAIAQADLNNVLSDPTKRGTADEVVARKKASAEFVKINADERKAIFDENEKFRQRDLDAEKNMIVRIKETQIEGYKQIQAETQFTLQDRLRAAANEFSAKKEIIDQEHRILLEQKRFIYLTDQEKLDIEKDYQNKLLISYNESNKNITAVLSAEIEKQQKLREDDLAQIKAIYDRVDLKGSSQYVEDVLALNQSLKKKEISLKEFNDRRRDIDKQYGIESLKQVSQRLLTELSLYKGAEGALSAAQLNLQQLQQQFDNAQTSGQKQVIAEKIKLAEKEVVSAKGFVDQKIELEKKLNETTKSLSDDSTNYDIENHRRRLNEIADSIGKYGELFQLAAENSSNQSDRRIQAIQDEQEALQERYQAEIDLINATYTSQINRDQKLKEAAAKNAAQKRTLDAQEKQERLNKAKFEKEAAIFSIILNTAKAIVNDLGNPFKVAFDAAIGAAELAVAIAAPLPRFFKGKDAADNYEGLGVVGDGGKSELIEREDGSMEVTNNKPSVTWIGRNDIIYPDASKVLAKIPNPESLLGLAKRTTDKVLDYSVTNNNQISQEQLINALGKHGSNIVKAIQNIPQTNIKVESVLDKWMRTGGSIDNYI
jgi:hypothetical protein